MKKIQLTPEELANFDLMDIVTKFRILNLELCGIFYVAAHKHVQEGIKKSKILDREIKKFYVKQSRLRKTYGDNSENYTVELWHMTRNLEPYYAPVVSNFSTAKILLVSCAEAYINEVASTILTTGDLQEFDKLSIIGKYIFIQDILKLKKRVKLGDKPLQLLGQLVKERNKLIHFKGRTDVVRHELPDFIEYLNLTPVSCLQNLEGVSSIISEISFNWLGQIGYSWMKVGKKGYREPCFYNGNRKGYTLLYSNKLDKENIQ